MTVAPVSIPAGMDAGIKSAATRSERAISVLRTFTEFAALLMIRKAILLGMVLVGVRNEPQGPAYLPPSGPRPAGGGGTGHPDDWAGDPANYEFSYEVQDAAAGLDFGHREMRKDNEATGSYHVLLPDGRTQIVDYIADEAGYRPMVRYEGTATYPAAAPAHTGGDEGYRY